MKGFIFAFNCTTNVSGGAVQNSVNFIVNLVEKKQLDSWCLMLSPAVYQQVSHLLSGASYEVFSSPAKSIKARKAILGYITNLNPTVVYTSAGPAYVDFPCKHVMGCSNPYILGIPTKSKKFEASRFRQFMRSLHTLYQRYYIKKSDWWIFQTTHSRDNFIKLMGVDKNRCTVVHNAISESFLNYKPFMAVSKKQDGKVRILYPSAYYPHKNFEILPDLIYGLALKGLDAEFTLTINNQKVWGELVNKCQKLGVAERLKNVGPYQHSDALSLFIQHDVIFQPSLVEVFSTSYIEAMAVGLPLVVADLPFSRSICQDYAEYFDVDNVNSCIDAVNVAVSRVHEADDRFKLGNKILVNYGSQADRFEIINDYILSKV